jgi:hypothetical protein
VCRSAATGIHARESCLGEVNGTDPPAGKG